jgi:adenine-specific DNA-methyltransferase
MFEGATATPPGTGSSITYTREPRRQRQLTLTPTSEIRHSVVLEPDLNDNHGEVFTRRWVVELILDLCGYDSRDDLANRVAVEPSCGQGAFLVPMVERLLTSCRQHSRSVSDATNAIRACDLLPANVQASRHAVTELLLRNGVEPRTATKLAAAWIIQDDFLLSDREVEADFVIGNPPYIRLEDVGESRSAAYRKACPTMGGRADVFIGFYECGLRTLAPGGRLAFICADRWMRNAYGKSLRSLVSSDYAVDAVITMHDVDAFHEQVAAYPAITVIRAGEQRRAAIADTTRDFDASSAGTLKQWFRNTGAEPLHDRGISAAWLAHWFSTPSGWPSGSPDRLAMVADLEERFPLLEETGAVVGIGLASGADDVYIVTDSTLVERERMLPIAMRSDLQSGTIRWSGHYLVNPWGTDGLVDLEDWQLLGAYFRRNWEKINGRNVAKRNPGKEFRTIDRVIAGLRERHKLFLADMSSRIWPVLDEGHYYPHHNLYWIHAGQSDWDLEVLGGILLSDIAELFISTYCVRMRGGTLRLQAQYLRRIRLPRYSSIADNDRMTLREAFRRRDADAASEVAHRLYDVDQVPA